MTDKARRLVHPCGLAADFRIAPSADVAELSRSGEGRLVVRRSG